MFSTGTYKPTFLFFDDFVAPDGVIVANAGNVITRTPPIGVPYEYGDGTNGFDIQNGQLLQAGANSGFLYAGVPGGVANNFKTIKLDLQILDAVSPGASKFDVYMRLPSDRGLFGVGIVARVYWQLVAGVPRVDFEWKTGAGDGPLGDQGLDGQVIAAQTTVPDIVDLTTAPLELTVTDNGREVSMQFAGSDFVLRASTTFSAAIAEGGYGVDFHGGAINDQIAVDDKRIQG